MQNPTSLAHQVASDMNLNRRQHNEAISAAELAMTMDPNDPNCHAQLARALIFGGRPSDAVDSVNSAMRLDPSNPARYLFLAGLAQFAMGQLRQSVTLIEKALNYNPAVCGQHRSQPPIRTWAAIRRLRLRVPISRKPMGWMPHLLLCGVLCTFGPSKTLKLWNVLLVGLLMQGSRDILPRISRRLANTG